MNHFRKSALVLDTLGGGLLKVQMAIFPFLYIKLKTHNFSIKFETILARDYCIGTIFMSVILKYLTSSNQRLLLVYF